METVVPGCALFAKHNLNWLKPGQDTPAFYACAVFGSNMQVVESDLMSNGLVGKDGLSMLTTIIPGPHTIVTFFAQDKFQGLQHTYTENWHEVCIRYYMMNPTKFDHCQAQCNHEIEILNYQPTIITNITPLYFKTGAVAFPLCGIN